MSTGIGVSSCCLSGSIHNGKPSGREETIAGIETYVAEPAGDSKAMSILLITDSMFIHPIMIFADLLKSLVGNCRIHA